jgi:CRP/FNR family transcriptional regulator
MNMTVMPQRTSFQPETRLSGLAPSLGRPRAVAVPFVADEPEDALSVLDGIGTSRRLARGQELFAEGDRAVSYFKVVSGSVRLLRLMPDGRRHVVDFFVAGDHFAFSPLQAYPYSAEGVVDSAVVAYPRRSVEQLIVRHPALARRLFELLSRELASAQDQLLLLGRKNAQERLASFLLMQLERAGQATAARPQLELVMSRTDIADHLGLTIETVSRGLTQLRRHGVIALPTPNQVQILKRDALERLQQGYEEGEA